MKICCIVCLAEVKNWNSEHHDENVVHPIGGTAFRTYGHYGSSVFDPMDASYLDIVVCDQCLKERMVHAYEGVNVERQIEATELRGRIRKKMANIDLDETFEEFVQWSTPNE